jgi:hypothetical protein
MQLDTMTAASFVALCKERNIAIECAQGSRVTLRKTFTPGSAEQYASAETDVSILYDTPSAGDGSVWGTDGGSVGGMVGMQGGYMRLNKSNVAKRFVAAVAKLI